jgi:hypothetical protein
VETDSWASFLSRVREEPSRFVGPLTTAHLQWCVTAPVRLMYELGAAEEVSAAVVHVSPCQCHVSINSGPLIYSLGSMVNWNKEDVLVDALCRVQERLFNETQDWAWPFRGPRGGLDGPFRGFFLADRGALAIRTSAGLWCQTYRSGWPTSPPFLVDGRSTPVGLMVASALSPIWFPGLPFNAESVRDAVPKDARSFVTIQWHDADEVVPECSIDSRCIMWPENLHNWL